MQVPIDARAARELGVRAGEEIAAEKRRRDVRDDAVDGEAEEDLVGVQREGLQLPRRRCERSDERRQGGRAGAERIAHGEGFVEPQVGGN